MMIPTVHNNGTAGEALVDQNMAALDAVRKAIDAVCEATPNARDYYVQWPEAPEAAKRDHEARVKALTTVRDELAAIVEAVQTQIDEREALRR